MDNLEYFKSKVRVALNIPKALLEYKNLSPTAQELVKEDARFASMPEEQQEIHLKLAKFFMEILDEIFNKPAVSENG